MIIKQYIAGPIEANNYLVADEKTKEAVLIDCSETVEKLLNDVKTLGLNVKYILLTHGHYDHMGGADALRRQYQIPILVHEDDRIMLETAAFNVSAEITGHPVILSPDRVLADGDKLLVDNQPVLVIHTPGHTRGGLCLVEGTSLFSGDTLFRQSMGRTDLYGGDERALLASLAKLASLPGDYTVYPGHGPATTLNWERQHNPYMRAHL